MKVPLDVLVLAHDALKTATTNPGTAIPIDELLKIADAMGRLGYYIAQLTKTQTAEVSVQEAE